MPSLKDLRNRINSVKSTQKITAAMVLKALGLKPNGRLGQMLSALAQRWFAFEAARAARA